MKKILPYSFIIALLLILVAYLSVPTLETTKTSISTNEGSSNSAPDQKSSPSFYSQSPSTSSKVMEGHQNQIIEQKEKPQRATPSWAIGIDKKDQAALYKSWLEWSKTQGPGIYTKKEFLAYIKENLYDTKGLNLEQILLLLKEDTTMSALFVQDLLTNSSYKESELKDNFLRLVNLCLLVDSTPACKDVHWLYNGYFYYSKEKTLKTLQSLFDSYDQCGTSAPYLLSQIEAKVSSEGYQENTPWCR